MDYTRMKGESAKAYDAFLTYLELGIDRSIEKVAKILGKQESGLHKWSKPFFWVIRAEAYDRVIETERLEKMKARAIAANEKHIEYAKTLSEKGMARLLKANLEKNNAGISVSEARLMVYTGVQMERDALGVEKRISVDLGSGTKQITGVIFELVENGQKEIINDGNKSAAGTSGEKQA
jgi:hypothetical protein